jgi:hypothetical protein
MSYDHEEPDSYAHVMVFCLHALRNLAATKTGHSSASLLHLHGMMVWTVDILLPHMAGGKYGSDYIDQDGMILSLVKHIPMMPAGREYIETVRCGCPC